MKFRLHLLPSAAMKNKRLENTISRRSFIHTTGLGTAALAIPGKALGSLLAQDSPVGPGRMPRITSVIRRDETILRLGGSGDNFHMSWAADDRQLVSVCDGMGWFEPPKGFYNSRLWAITGTPRDATFQDMPDYPDLRYPWNFFRPDFRRENYPKYYNFGTLALDGHIYQFLGTLNHWSLGSDGTTGPDMRFVGAKLIYSPDNGRTWCNQDGSTPAVWEPMRHRSRQNMVFFEEPQDAFSLLTVLQMGRNYEANRDGYVYVYAPNGATDGTMNQLVMFRAPKAAILDRQAYEYFSGLRPDGSATWVTDIHARTVVHTFPGGWVNRLDHPWAWMPSVVYNAPLGLYLMTSWGTGVAPDGHWFGKPSYLGFWTAPNPWGPWTQIHEETAWTPGDDPAARAYSPQISPKWIAADGKSFWLVWTDYQLKGDTAEMQRIRDERKREYERVANGTQADLIRWISQYRRVMPYYSFNAQRVDLVIA
jgi:hypothetical protein